MENDDKISIYTIGHSNLAVDTILLTEITTEKSVVGMCSEENPERYHRQHLFAQTLLEREIRVQHVREDASLELAQLSTEAV